MRDAESNHRVGMTGLDPYSMVTLIYRLSRARNFLLQSSAKLTTGIPRVNQKPTQDCLSRLQDSLSWLGLGAHEGYQWCQQTTSMRFQALRSCTKPQTSWGSGEGGGGGGGGGFTGLISFAAYSWNTILRPVPRKVIKFKINFDTVELQKTYGKIKVFEKLITDFFALQI